MTRLKRKIITIDEERCDGCGNCVPACAEGALRIVEGKARLVKESYCDGLGACLGECPQGALTVLELEAEEFDEREVIAYLRSPLGKVTAPDPLRGEPAPPGNLAHARQSDAAVEQSDTAMQGHAGLPPMRQPIPSPALHQTSRIPRTGAVSGIAGQCGASVAACPSVQMSSWMDEAEPGPAQPRSRSELRQWPVQLHLLPPQAPFFHEADLTLIADCVPFAYPNLHADYMKGSAIAIGCPKLDDAGAYVQKLTQILLNSDVKSLRVLHMEVPCCGGLVRIARQALQNSGKDLPFESVLIRIAQ